MDKNRDYWLAVAKMIVGDPVEKAGIWCAVQMRKGSYKDRPFKTREDAAEANRIEAELLTNKLVIAHEKREKERLEGRRVSATVGRRKRPIRRNLEAPSIG